MAIATDPLAPPVDDDPAPRRPFLFEVIDGRIVRCKPMGSQEAELASILDQLLGAFARSQSLGKVVIEMLFRLDEARRLSRRPDVAFVSAARWPVRRRVPRGNAWAVVPDLAIEVISRTNTAEEIAAKIRDYFTCGVQRAWVVYPVSEQVYVYDSATTIRVLTRRDALDGETLLPGFRLPLADLFGDDEGATP